jgi:hypothetical protein
VPWPTPARAPGTSTVPAGLAAGGGVEISRFSTATITDSTISNNTAVGGTGGAGADGGNAYGGGLAIITSSSATVNDSDIENNSATGGHKGRGGSDGQGVGGEGAGEVLRGRKELTASVETVGGLGRRYEGEEALKLREAVQALCVHATAEEWPR